MQNVIRPYQRFILTASIIIIGLGILVILGWIFNVPWLMSVIPGYATMKFNTAIGLTVSGAALYTQIRQKGEKRNLIFHSLSIFIALIGSLYLFQYYTGVDIGIDELFVSDIPARVQNLGNPGRMSPVTAWCFFLIGIALSGTESRKPLLVSFSQTAFHVVTLLSFIAMVGYIFDVPAFYKLSFLTSIAVHTAFGLFIISIACSLLNSTTGITGLFTGKKIGNQIARSLFVEMTIAILVLTFLRIESQRFQLVDVEFGIVLFAMSFILTSLFLIWRASMALNRVEAVKDHAESGLQQLQVILEATPDPLLVIDDRSLIKMANSRADKAFGYDPGQLSGKNIDLLVPERFRKQVADIVKTLFDGSFNPEFLSDQNFRVLSKDGTEIPVEVTLSPFKSSGVDFFSVAFRDISERLKTQQILKLSNERNRIFVDQAPNALAMFDRDMKYMAASKRWIENYNLTGQEIIGRSHYEIFPEIGEDWKAIHQECLQGNVNVCDEAAFVRADGSVQWIAWEVRPWFISDSEIGGILMYTADVTELKNKDEERRKVENILKRSNEVAKIAHWEVDLSAAETKWSSMANEIFELPKDYQPNQKEIFEFYKKGPNLDNLLESIDTSAVTGKSYDLEIDMVSAHGTEKWLRIIGEVESKNGIGIRRFGIIQDITNAKQIERELKQSNEELNALFNSGHVSIIGTDTKGLITHFNLGAEKMLQYSSKEMVHLHTPQLIHVEDEVVARGTELSKVYKKKIEGFDVFTELARHEDFDSREWTYVRKDGSTFSVQLVITAIRDSMGEIHGYLGVATDITERKKAEIEKKTLLELTQDQNERLKNFAHIVSHNLRSHTGNFGMLLELMKADHPELNENEYIGLLEQASNNLMETISNLNEVVVLNSTLVQNLVLLNLKAATVSAIKNVKALADEASVLITDEIDPNTSVLALPAYLESILLNFITNGIKYRSAGRDSYILLSSYYEKDYVVIKVEDNGLGMDLKKLGGKLFGMYKTFHGNKDARGIGLFITKNQVEAMGGKVEVESEVDKGTIFKIYLKHEKN